MELSIQTLVFFGPLVGAVPRAMLGVGMTVAPEPAELGGEVRGAPPVEDANGCALVGVRSPTSGDGRICW